MTNIRDELTPEQLNETANDFLAQMVFNALFLNNDPDQARQQLGMMNDEKLLLLFRAARYLAALASGEYGRRRARKGGKASND